MIEGSDLFIFKILKQLAYGMIDNFEMKSQLITKVMVLKAYVKVHPNISSSRVIGMSLENFMFRHVMCDISGRRIFMTGIFVSSASKTFIRRHLKDLDLYKRRKPIKEPAWELNPVNKSII